MLYLPHDHVEMLLPDPLIEPMRQFDPRYYKIRAEQLSIEFLTGFWLGNCRREALSNCIQLNTTLG
jgi:hypothetical protein